MGNTAEETESMEQNAQENKCARLSFLDSSRPGQTAMPIVASCCYSWNRRPGI